MKERFTGPRAKLAAAGVAAASVAAACTPEQLAYVQRLLPCEPGPITAEGGQGTEGDKTAVLRRSDPVELPAFLTNGEQVVICFPQGEQISQPISPDTEAFFAKIHEDKSEIKPTHNIIQELEATYSENPEAEEIWSLRAAKKTFKMGETGDPKSAPTKDYIERNKAIGYTTFIEYMYVDLFYGTQDERFLTLAYDVTRRAISKIKAGNFDEKLQKALTEYLKIYQLLQQANT